MLFKNQVVNHRNINRMINVFIVYLLTNRYDVIYKSLCESDKTYRLQPSSNFPNFILPNIENSVNLLLILFEAEMREGERGK